ncbi:MAG: NDP-sugar synthase, partial [Candidatus Diapherotrites archaeon]|nr:NDP-sugar synthase [Candidatus Diapherotrites archaeon]
LIEVDDPTQYGIAQMKGEQIMRFVEKPSRAEAPSRFANAGAYIIEKKAMEGLPSGFNFIERTLFPELAREGKLFGIIHRGQWFPTDTLQRLQAAEEMFKPIQ